MALLSLVIEPDPRLHIKSKPVDKVDDEIRTLMDNMLETMYHEGGIGLSAVQVGIHKRVLVMDVERGSERYGNVDEKASKPIYMANPEITWASEELNCYNEGCLSFPGEYSEVVRPARVTVEYLDYKNRKQTLEADGLLATCVQHEIDHLDGIVFTDHISSLKRDIILRKMKKRKKRAGDN